MVTGDVTEILELVAEAVGHTLQVFRPIQEQVYGDGIIRSFDLGLRGPEGTQISQVVYVETSPAGDPRDGILVFREGVTGDEVAVWLYPTDPELPALPTAVFPHAASVVLRRMGVDDEGLQLSLNGYRPGKRAVVRARSHNAVVWLKVVRPNMVEQLTQTYRLWAEWELPVPGIVGWAEEGLVAFTELAEVPATSMVPDLDDAAALYAHLIVSALFDRERGRGASESYERLATAWLQRVSPLAPSDPTRYRRVIAISATHLIAHTLGSSAHPEELLGRAEALLAR